MKAFAEIPVIEAIGHAAFLWNSNKKHLAFYRKPCWTLPRSNLLADHERSQGTCRSKINEVLEQVKAFVRTK
jgi:hypothetical protein